MVKSIVINSEEEWKDYLKDKISTKNIEYRIISKPQRYPSVIQEDERLVKCSINIVTN
jgi:predicted choloylglycine hydrolase